MTESSVRPGLVGQFRNRIVDFKYLPSEKIHSHPKNWRQHPPDQASLLSRLMSEIGFASVLVVRQRPDEEYEILDGHLRTGILGDSAEVPAVILDVTEKESEKLLASYDPIALMAEASLDRLQELMQEDLFKDPSIFEDLEKLLMGGDELAVFDVKRPLTEGKESSIVGPPPDLWRVSVLARTESEKDRAAELLESSGFEVEVKPIHQWDSGV